MNKWLWCSLVLGCVATAKSSSAEEPKIIIVSPDEVIKKLIELDAATRQMELEVEQQRLDVISRALELDAERKKAAANEREVVEREIKSLELLVAEKKWALRQFESDERGLLPSVSNAPAVHARWKKMRQVSREKFVNFPEESRGEIKSGVALNFFVDTCGPTILAHQLQREQFKLESDSAKLAGQSAASGEDWTDIRSTLLDELHGTQSLSRETLADLVLEKGLTRPRLRVRLGGAAQDSILPLEWPGVLKEMDDFALPRARIETAKSRGIKQLQQQPDNAENGIATEVKRELMEAIDDLCGTFDKSYEQHLQKIRQGIAGARGTNEHIDAAQWVTSRNYLRELRSGAARLLAVRSRRDVIPGDFPPSHQASISVDELLAYMCRHGLRFGRAEDQPTENANEFVYKLLVQYYLDLYCLRLSLESDENKVEYLDREVEDLKQVQFEAFVNPLSEARAQWKIGWSEKDGITIGVESR